MKSLLTFASLFLVALGRGAAIEVTFKLADSKGAPIADAVVSLVALDAPPALSSSNGAKISAPVAPLEIAQSGQEFSTFVTPLVVGSTVNFPNFDKVSHQVYSLSPTKKFALPLYKPGNGSTVVFDRPGVVALGCNIHDWMLAYIVVLETPHFAKTATDGTATIIAPAGRYRAEVWHARLAKNETRELILAEGAPPPAQSFTLALKPDRRIRRAPDATGGGYK